MNKIDVNTDCGTGIAAATCGLRRVLGVIGGKWKILILCSLDEAGIMRYGELRRKVKGITNAMLASSLQELEKDDLVVRHQYMEMPVRVEYELTEKCKSLIPILLELKAWGEDHLPVSAAQTHKKK